MWFFVVLPVFMHHLGFYVVYVDQSVGIQLVCKNMLTYLFT